MAESEGFEPVSMDTRDAILGDIVDIIVRRGVTIGQFYGVVGVNEEEFVQSDAVTSAVDFMRGMLHSLERQ